MKGIQMKGFVLAVVILMDGFGLVQSCPASFDVYNIAPFQPGSEKRLAAEMVEYRARTGNWCGWS